MKIAVVGTGYVGLVTGTCLAETGNEVICVDVDKEKVRKMQEGIVPIYEPGLEILFSRNIKQSRLSFTTVLKDAVDVSDIIFLALPTPPDGDGAADLSYVLGVADELGKMITNYKVIVDKSTVPVGTAEKVHDAIARHAKVDFDVVSNPEFLREGVAIDDFMKPDRVVIGTTSERAQKVMAELYAPFIRQGNPLIFMDERSAELTKYAANAFLATKISFMNEIANLCELTGANVDSIRRGIGADDRIGKRFLFAGIGYGGSCFPKDVQALAKSSRDYRYDFKILNAVMEVNNRQRLIMVDKIRRYFNNMLQGRTIAVWGLSFKPETDDIREAPALYMIDELLKEHVTINVFDPEAIKHVRNMLGNKVNYFESQYDALSGADALLIATEWSVFRTPDFERMEKLLKSKVIFDGRNLYDLAKMEELGFHYESIGREKIMAHHEG